MRPGITTFRIGAPPDRRTGLRIAATRRPPRGVPKAEWAALFDLWLPLIAPSAPIVKRALADGLDDERVRRRFFAAYRRELAAGDISRTLDLLAAVAVRMPVSVGCFCADETHCHRSVLKQAIQARMPASRR